MNEDPRVYGFTGDRSKLIRWELVVLVTYWFCILVFPGWVRFQHDPYVQRLNVLDVIAPALGASVLVLWLIWISGDSFEMFGIRRPEKRDGAWLGALAAFVFLEKSLLSYRLFSMLQKTRIEPKSYLDMVFGLNPILFFINLAAYLIPAAFEELFYRGILQTRIQEISENAFAAIGGSAALFAISHIYQGPQNLPYHLGFGLVFSFARWKGCSLWPLILGHAFYNSLVFPYS